MSKGWILVKQNYDDGGIFGGTMERSVLKQILQDIEEGHVDIIVVYKVDRLTSSLSDFAPIIERLDQVVASIVPVTQQLKISNSMGGRTLNVLLSFDQLEREVISERIRDIIEASWKQGVWMGDTIPFGYEFQVKKHYIN